MKKLYFCIVLLFLCSAKSSDFACKKVLLSIDFKIRQLLQRAEDAIQKIQEKESEKKTTSLIDSIASNEELNSIKHELENLAIKLDEPNKSRLKCIITSLKLKIRNQNHNESAKQWSLF